MKRPAALLSLIALLPAPGSAWAQEPVLEPVVVEALGDPGAASPTERRVIDARELEARTGLELAEALRAEPGVALVRQGGPGEDVLLRLRGADPAHTLVLLDGVPLNDPFVYGLARLAALDPGGVDRIELVRGPFSALDAAAAIGGVVRLRTLRAGGGAGLSGRVDAGAPYTLRLSGSAASGAEQGAAVFASFTDAGEPAGLLREGSSSRRTTESRYRDVTAAASASDELLGGELSAAVRIGMSTRRLGINLLEGGPVTAAYPDSARDVERSLTVASLRFASDSDGPHAFSLRAGLARLGSTDSDAAVAGEGALIPGLGSAQFAGTVARRSTTLVVGTDHALAVGAGNTLLAGAELLALSGSSAGTLGILGPDLRPLVELDLGAEDSRLAFGGYLADRLEHGSFDLEAGLRVDGDDRYGEALSPRVTAGARVPVAATRVTASYGEGFRAPSFIELAGTPFSNPELTEEHARSVELAAIQPLDELLGSASRFSVAAFQTDYDGLVVLGEERLVNEETATIRGLELALDLRGRVRGGAALTLLRGSTGSGEELVGVPPVGGSARAGVSAGRFDADAYLYAWAEHRATELQDLAGVVRDRTPAGSRVDLSSSAWLAEGSPSLRLGARLEDALDGRAEEVVGFPAPGRTVLVTLELSDR